LKTQNSKILIKKKKEFGKKTFCNFVTQKSDPTLQKKKHLKTNNFFGKKIGKHFF
jgi:hypothetical protein